MSAKPIGMLQFDKGSLPALRSNVLAREAYIRQSGWIIYVIANT